MNKPPKVARFLLRILSSRERDEAFRGDMEELYFNRSEYQGTWRSRSWYWREVFRSIPRFFIEFFRWRITMLGNYIKIVFRNMQRHKGYTFINTAGIAVGIACTIIIFLWVQDELSYDRFHQKAERIYRVVFSSADDGIPTNANGSYGVGPALKKDFPEVMETVRIRKMGQNVKRYVGYQDNKFYESRFFFAEPSLFTVFDFPLIKGDPEEALTAPNSIVLTEDTAQKYFGKQDPLGKIIEADPYNDGELMLFHVTGIAKNVPRNSHFQFDFLASYSSLKEDTTAFGGYYQHCTYVLLNSTSSAQSLNNKLLDFLHRNWREDPWYTISLQPLLDIHLHSRLRSEIEPNGNILYVYIFTAVALFVLLIACINFMNLATARAVKRAKEVGMRKVVGARKNQLIFQFLGESLLLSFVSALAAVLVVIIALPQFNNLTGKGITITALSNPSFISGLSIIALMVGLLAGVYPAFFLSAYKPVNTLRSRSSRSVSGTVLRKGLVIFQFVLSIGIIVSTLIVQKQMKFIQSRNLGYDKEQIMVISLNKDLRQNYEALRNELLKDHSIENMATSSLVPTRGSYHLNLRFEDRNDELTQVIYEIDEEFVDTYGIKLLAGENIQSSRSSDGTAKILVSEQTTKEAGYTYHQEAVGKSFILGEIRGHIAGIVNDMNIYSLHRPSLSITYFINHISSHNYLSIRIRPHNFSETLRYIQTKWQEMIPNYPFDYFFLDESFEQMHLSDKKMGEIFSIFSLLAVFVACMGLFGLAAHTAQQKTKEIGIRKILGASISNIYLQLSWDFIKWVALANIIAWPAAYYAMKKWLQNFAFRTSVGWDIFILSAGLAVAVALITVSFQSLKAARSNPADSLRFE